MGVGRGVSLGGGGKFGPNCILPPSHFPIQIKSYILSYNVPGLSLTGGSGGGIELGLGVGMVGVGVVIVGDVVVVVVVDSPTLLIAAALVLGTSNDEWIWVL